MAGFRATLDDFGFTEISTPKIVGSATESGANVFGLDYFGRADYLAALAERGEDPLSYESYLAVFAAGMPPHGGFAMGLERWTARLTGADNVRRVTLFPRDLHRLTP